MALDKALVSELNVGKRQIVRARFGLMGDGETEFKPMTLNELGPVFSVSRDRVRQIEDRALGQMHGFLAGSLWEQQWRLLATIDATDVNMGLEQPVTENYPDYDSKIQAAARLVEYMRQRDAAMTERLKQIPGYAEKQLLWSIGLAGLKVARYKKFWKNAEAWGDEVPGPSSMTFRWQYAHAEKELEQLLQLAEKPITQPTRYI